ncbi:MAG: GNAT family N-acetyltransferase [Aggregatilineales bacterium]
MTVDKLGMLFTGDLVRLAAKQADDNKLVVQWENDAEYMRFLEFNAARPHSADELNRFDEDNKEDHESGRAFEFMFRTITDDKVIGLGELWIQWNHRNAWLSIGIGEPEYRGKGYGTDAMRLLIGFGFRELDLHRIQLGVFSNNPRAIRCYEKVGFVREVVKRAEIYRDGQRVDGYVMGLLRSEWEAQQFSRSS